MAENHSEPNLLLRQPAVAVAIGVVATLVLALGVILTLLLTGGGKAVSNNAAVIGALVGLGGVFTTQLVSIALDDRRARETRAIEEQRTNDTHAIEERRAKETRAIEERREQEASLQQYFEEMGTLLRQGLRRSYTKETGELLAQGLLEPHERDEQRTYEEQQLRSLAQVQTILILRGLDPRRKWLLLSFLLDSNLIDRDAAIINLANSDLRKAIFCEYLAMDKPAASRYLLNDTDPSNYLSKDDLSTVLQSSEGDLEDFLYILEDTRIYFNPGEVALQRAILVKAFLRSAGLSGADLGGTFLSEADLIHADLSNAYLGAAQLGDAVLMAANLNKANLNRVGAYGAVFVKANLTGTNLYKADLGEANLRLANLSDADLSGADLSGADLSGADLSGADLLRARHLAQEQIDWTIGSSETTLPKGLDRPELWSKPIEEQVQIVQDHWEGVD